VGRPPRGISLVEVLISVGVLTMGLLGVAALMPLAVHQAQRGVLEDRKAAAGRRAFREFKIRGMTNADSWIGDVFAVVNGGPMLRRMPYCLDPLGVAATGSELFPEVRATASGAAPTMARITLSSAPRMGSLAFARERLQTSQRGRNVTVPMPLQQAIDVFTVQDDLVFEVPEQEVLPPQQTWLPRDPKFTTLKRYAEGRFTWLATIVPEFVTGITSVATQPNFQNDLYRLSIVITYQRVPDVDVRREQVASVTFLGADATRLVAYGGGDVELASANGTDPISTRAGDWIMLSQAVANGQFDFRWYRVVAADENIDQPKRQMTLQGPDWPVRGRVWATLVPGAVAVYEKTIRLEDSTLWTSYPTL
jgi:hypothetical protein